MQMMRAIADKGCKRIITVGSQAEYGITTGCVEENYVCKPNTQYGIYKYKLFEETFQLCVKKGIQYKAPRIFSVYGPNDNEETLVMSCINKMVVGKPCYLTMCNQEWDYLFVDDAVEALIALTERECMDGVYNLGSGDCRLLKEYVYEMKAILNSKSEIVFGAVSYPSSGIVNVHPSIERIAREVNWRANTSFKEGIGKGKKIAIFTERAEFMTEYLFQKSGWSSENIPVCVYDLPENSDFYSFWIFSMGFSDAVWGKKDTARA